MVFPRFPTRFLLFSHVFPAALPRLPAPGLAFAAPALVVGVGQGAEYVGALSGASGVATPLESFAKNT